MGLAWHDYHGDVIGIDGGAGAGACCVAAASGWCGRVKSGGEFLI